MSIECRDRGRLCGTLGQLAPEGRAIEISGLGLPEGVKEVVGRRLSRLSETCNRVLSVAAAMGREFDVDILQQVAAISNDEVIDALEQTCALNWWTSRGRRRDVSLSLMP